MKRVLFILIIIFPVISATSSGIIPMNNDQALREKIAKDLIAAFVREDYEGVSANFHATLKQTLPQEKLQEVWQNVVNTYGKYVETKSTTNVIQSGYHQVVSRLKFEKDNLTLEMTFNEDDKLIGFYFKA